MKKIKTAMTFVLLYVFFFMILAGLYGNYDESSTLIPSIVVGGFAVVSASITVGVIKRLSAYWADINRPRSEYHRSDYRK